MKLRLHPKRPDPWAVRRRSIKHTWTVPLWAFQWFWEWVAYALSNWSFLESLEYLSSFGVLVAVVFYFAESGDRLKQKHYQAWLVINTAQGKGGNGGRIEALQELNSDDVSLVGVDASGAFLQGIQLEHARLVRCNFNSADIRDSDFAFADFSDAELRGANFRNDNLRNATLQRANLSEADLTSADLNNADLSGANLADADLTGANLTNVWWKNLRSVQGANFFGVQNAPAGFLAWALQNGAVQRSSGSQ